jgi:DNA polymerase
MRNMSIDLETYSPVNLAKSGVYRYSESPDFEVLLFGYSMDGGEVRTIDLASGETLPEEVRNALTDPDVMKWAFNASFERVCLSRYLGLPAHTYLDPKQWHCSMIWSAYMGLPLSLKGSGAVLGLEKQKLTEGKELIKYFCVPCQPTKANGGRTRNMPSDAPDKWGLFKTYNIRDVETEMEIQHKLRNFPVPEQVWKEYCMDQEINDRGILVDMTLVDQAIELDQISREKLSAEIQQQTGLDNPNSVSQMKEWLSENGLEMETLGKKAVAAVLKDTSGELTDVLTLRQQLAKSSVKKYTAMKNAVCSDGRVRGMFQFYGANRTGRFAGRLVQLQNLPQNHMSDLAEARALVRSGKHEALTTLYDDIPDTLSQLIRTAFIPKPGMKFYVADFSSIEARVLAWVAGETHTIESFAKGEDLYCATASAMFGVPVVKHGINGNLRQKGKVATLACGYGGSVGALKAMGALDMGLTEEELPGIVQAWRNANPHIVRFWWDVDKAVKDAVKTRQVQRTHGLTFICRSGMLFIRLLSGRELAYVKPRIGENRFGGESVTYEGIGGTKKWERLESYGPKFVENIVQATSRDILMHSIENLRDYRIVAHVHDELIIEADKDTSLDFLCKKMAEVPDWAEGLLLRADGYTCDFYKKD